MIETHPNGYIDGKAADGGWSKSLLAWLLLGLIAVSVFALRSQWGRIVNFPDSWVLPFSEWVNLFMDWFVSNNKAGFRLFSEIQLISDDLSIPMTKLTLDNYRESYSKILRESIFSFE